MSLSVAMTVMPYAAASRGIPSADTSAVRIDSASVTAVRSLGDAGIYVVDQDACVDCGACEDGCPTGAIKAE